MKILKNRAQDISEFVEEAMGTPEPDTFDWWQESAYAALFSSSFELFMIYSVATTKSEIEFNKLLKFFVGELAEQATIWIREGFTESLSTEYQGRLVLGEESTKSEVNRRLSSYFMVALTAMADRDFDIETARSHSCFTILSKILNDLSKVDKSILKWQLKSFFNDVIDDCDSLANDWHVELNNRLKH